MSKKLITFCVFGTEKLFQKGCFENLRLAKEIYPDWICRVYLFKETLGLKDEILSYGNSEVVEVNEMGSFVSTMYRFLPLAESDVSYFISRDTDSRLSMREKEAVDEWIKDGTDFHIMKDHPYHYTPEFPILAGMWGARGGIIPNVKELMAKIVNEHPNTKGIDQRFLYHIFETHVNKFTEHEMNGFPSPRNFERDGIYFVGQPFDGDNNFYGNWKEDLNKLGINI